MPRDLHHSPPLTDKIPRRDTFFLIFLPPLPLLLLSFSIVSGRSRLTTPRGACCGFSLRPGRVSAIYVMLYQVADFIGDGSYGFLYDISLQRSSGRLFDNCLDSS